MLRVYRLGAQNIWWDEGLAIWSVRKSFSGTTLWTAADVHPPLYFWLLWPWTRLTGESEFAARYITLIFGVLTVALAYALAHRIAGWRLGLLAASLVAVSRFEVWWSQEMRMYMLAGTCGLLATYWLVRTVGVRPARGHRDVGAADRSDRRWWAARPWAWYVLSMLGALYTVYLSAVFVIAHNLWVLWLAIRNRLPARGAYLRRWILAQVTIGALLLPWLALSIPRMRSWRIVEEPPTLRFVAQLWATLLATGTSTDIGAAWLPTAVILLVLFMGLLSTSRIIHHVSRSTYHSLLIILFLLPPLLVWAVTQPRSIFYSPRIEARYLVPFAAPAYVLLAAGIWGLWRRWRPVGIGALAVVVGVAIWALPTHYRDRYLRDELQTMTQVIRAYVQPGDAVVLVSGNRYPIFLYYYERTWDAGDSPPPVYRLPGGGEEFDAANVADKVEPIAARHDRLWLAEVDRQLQDPAGLAQTWLGEHRQRILSLGFDHNALHLYAGSPGEPMVHGTPWLGSLDTELGQARVLGYDLVTREYRPGDEIHLGLYLTAPAPLRLPVRWVHDSGLPLAEVVVDVPATGGGVIRRQVVFQVTDAVPGGDYHFALRGPPALASQPKGDAEFGRLRVARTHGPAPAAQPEAVTNAHFDEGIELVGYTLHDASRHPATSLRPGQTLYLDLFWQVAEPVDGRLTVFTHLLGSTHNPETDGPVWAGHDSEPVMGAAPTTRWPVGTTIIDRHPLTLDVDAPPGEYQIEVGLYDMTTGERLPVSGAAADAANRRILLGTAKVE
jgi:4-amino-4-deoxy-L-arabinose transferase-like glycosyltransferase